MNLKDTQYAPDIITISYDHEAIKNKDVNINNQICPGDFTNNCYTSPGMFTLSAADAPADSKNELCRALSKIFRIVYRMSTKEWRGWIEYIFCHNEQRI